MCDRCKEDYSTAKSYVNVTYAPNIKDEELAIPELEYYIVVDWAKRCEHCVLYD